MEQRNNNQNSIIFNIEELLNKMSNQIRFLIRNEEPMSQLDLDLMMKNTRKLYDTLCSVELENHIEVEADINENDDNLEEAYSPSENIIEFEKTEIQETVIVDNIDNEEDTDFNEVELPSDDIIEFEKTEIQETEIVDNIDSEEDTDFNEVELPSDNTIEFEISETQEDETNSETAHNSNDEIKFKHKEDEEIDSGIRVYMRVHNEHNTLGDMLEHTEDNSLAARLQRKPIADLMTAIGINDKFLFLNDLFGGSMEKYNKSIRSLNNFSTLLGAKTYMSELQIEFQWDCESEAYKKLNDLIERRFISIHNS